jgi:hypothetical protein
MYVRYHGVCKNSNAPEVLGPTTEASHHNVNWSNSYG